MDWITNGDRAMNLWECSGNDLGFLIALSILVIAVIVQHAEVAFMAYREYRRRGAETYSASFLWLGAVFVFCSIAGYLLTFLSIFFPTYRLKTLFLVPLVIATFGLIWRMKRTGFVYKIFQLDELLEKTAKEHPKNRT